MERMDAVVLCGGFGTRLGPALAGHKCKSLFPILGRPSLWYVLEALRRAACARCILCIDRDELRADIAALGKAAGIGYEIFLDSGGGPSRVAQEAAGRVSTPHFLMLHGHQIVFPDHIRRLMAAGRDFMATVFPESSEGIKKVATVDSAGRCTNLRRGSFQRPATEGELYLDKPYVLRTDVMRASMVSATEGDPRSPVCSDLRPDTILRYAQPLYVALAAFRHEFHHPDELPDVECTARRFLEAQWNTDSALPG